MDKIEPMLISRKDVISILGVRFCETDLPFPSLPFLEVSMSSDTDGSAAVARRRESKTRKLAAPKNRKSRKEDAQRKEAELYQKKKVAHGFRVQGYSYRAIGEELSVDPSTVWRWVNETIEQDPHDSIDATRDLELARLDVMQHKFFELFLQQPDPVFADGILKLMAARAKYTGLIDIPTGRNSQPARHAPMSDEEFRKTLDDDRPVIELKALPPMVLRPDEPVPANPIL